MSLDGILRRRLGMASAALAVVIATLVLPTEVLPVLPGQVAHAVACPSSTDLLNGSFETPDLPASNTATRPGWIRQGDEGIWLVPQGQVPGWTATNGYIEMWKSGANGVGSPNGAQFAEVNGTYSQTIDTSALQGQMLRWRFVHRGRAGVDTMDMSLGPPGGPANFSRRARTGQTWTAYDGAYTVPLGQMSTTISFTHIDSSNGRPGFGNMLDRVQLVPLTCTMDLSVDKTTDAASYLPGGPITYTITVTNTGEIAGQYDVVDATLSDAVPAAITGVTWTCAASVGSSCGEPSGTGNAIATTYDVLEGGTVTYTVTGTAPTAAPLPALSNTATVAVPVGLTDIDTTNNTATAEIVASQPALSLVKSADSAELPPVGSDITYTFSVTNTGTVALTDVEVSDPLIGDAAIDCGTGTNDIVALAPGETAECAAAYTVTETDASAGTITNTATVTATPPAGLDPPTDTSSTTVPFTPSPALTVVKSSDADQPVALGDVITYSYAITNTGNVTLAPIVVVDGHDGLSAIDCGGPDGNDVIESMAPGGPVNCTATYTVTAADIAVGSIVNTVTATGTTITDPESEVQATDDLEIVTEEPAPSLALDKGASYAAQLAVSDTVTYELVLTNTGNVTLTDITITDPLPGLSPIDCDGDGVIATLAPGAAITCTATYVVTQTDADAGGITNTATATATPPPGSPPVTPVEVGTGVPIDRVADVSIVKSSDALADPVTEGQLITYAFSVSNTGNVALTDLTVTDPVVGNETIDCGSGSNVIPSLAPDTNPVECTATYEVTQPDVDAGSITNTATVTATPPAGLDPPTDTSTVESPFEAAPALELVKSASATAPVVLGDVIAYTFTADNTGNVTLTDVEVNDDLAGLSPIDCGGTDGNNVIETFAPGGPVTCTATYTVTQSDVDAGTVTNSATATGTPPDGAPPLAPPTDTVDVDVERIADIALVKSLDSPDLPAEGDPITYTFSVTNTGTVTLTDVTVTDPLDGLSPIDCAGETSIPTLAPGANVECTATYLVQQEDIDTGTLANTATVTGTPPAGLTPPTDESSAESPFPPEPGLEVVKSAEYTDPVAAGDEITYEVAVTNTGNVTLTGITLTDSLVTLDCGDGTPTIASMAPGGPVTCTAIYTVSQDDVDAGGVTNTVTATGTPPPGSPPLPPPPPSTVNVAIAPRPVLSINKSSSTAGPVDAGDTITYTIAVANTGNVTLSDVTVSDLMLGAAAVDCGDGTNTIASLAPQAPAVTCTASYVVTPADMNAGAINNVASATGTPPGTEQPLTPVEDGEIVTANQVAELSLTKSSDYVAGEVVAVGDIVTYSFSVTNTGTVALTNVTVTDPLVDPAVIDCGAGTNVVPTLAPGDAPVVCTAPYSLLQEDIDGGVTNTATVTGTPPEGLVPPTDTSTVTSPFEAAPALELVKSATVPDAVGVGDDVPYSFAVTNTGNVTLTDVVVTDALEGLTPIDCGGSDGDNVIESFAPGGPVICTATYTVTQADVDAGSISNTATATGTPPDGVTPPTPPTGTVEVPIEAAPGLAFTKSISAPQLPAVDEEITYTFSVTNVGNVTLTNVTVTDPLLDGAPIDCGDGTAEIPSLAPGANVECTARYEVTQTDIDEGITNTATVTGTTPAGETTQATDDAATPFTPTPGIELAKSADFTSPIAAGDTITYDLAVTNTGNVTLTDVTIDDDHAAVDCGDGTPTIASMAPGGPVTCTATYTVSPGDIDAGAVANTASVTGTAPDDTTVSDTSTANVPIVPRPAISIVKSADTAGPVAVDDVITYTLTATNTGTVTLNNVTVTDSLAGAVVDCGDGTNVIGTLAAGAVAAPCNATYTIVQADVDAGSVDNLATVRGTPPTGPPVVAEGAVAVPADQRSAMTVDKAADPPIPDPIVVDDVITYTLTATNTGTVTLTDVTVTDSRDGVLVDCGDGTGVVSTLAPTASVACRASYTVTQADVDAGTVSNSATATATPPEGAPPLTPPTDTVDLPIEPDPGLTLVKSFDPATLANVDEVLTYTFSVTNTGNVTLTDVSVIDQLEGLSPIDCDGDAVVAILAPQANVVCTATYTVAPADADAGEVTNTATATGATPDGGSTSATDTATAPFDRLPGLAIEKFADTTGPVVAGDEITYTFRVTNTGNVTLSDVTIVDPLVGPEAIDCGGDDGDGMIESFPAGGSTDCTTTYTVSQDDVDAGGVTNSATATGTPPGGAPPLEPTPPAIVDVPSERRPGLAIDKVGAADGPVAAGDALPFTITVTNTGTVTLTAITVTDTLVEAANVDCGDGTNVIARLAPTDPPVTCFATYTIAPADIEVGAVTNSATATGTPPEGSPPLTPAEVTTEVPLEPVPAPALDLQKTSDAADPGIGSVITYTFTLTNTGNVPLSQVTVSDPLPGLSPIDCGDGTNVVASLDLDTTATCTATYTVGPTDVANRQIVNAASASGRAPSGELVGDETSLLILLEPDVSGEPTAPLVAAIEIDKTIMAITDTTGDGPTAGDTITYGFVVSNTGTIGLDSIAVDDPMLGGAIACGSGPLAPQTSRTCSPATYALTGADIGTSVENSASVSAVAEGGATLSDEDAVVAALEPPCFAVVATSEAVSTTTSSSTAPTTVSTTGGLEIVAPTSTASPVEVSTSPSTSTDTTSGGVTGQPVGTITPESTSSSPSSSTTTEPTTNETTPTATPAGLRRNTAEAHPTQWPAQITCTSTTTTMVASTTTTVPGPGGAPPTPPPSTRGVGEVPAGPLPATGGDPGMVGVVAAIVTCAGLWLASRSRGRHAGARGDE